MSSTLVWISAVSMLWLWLPLLLWLIPLNWVWFLTAFFFWGGKLVQLCLSMLTWAPPCMFDECCLMCLVVALQDSSFLVILLTFAAGYCGMSVFPSLIVLAINSVSNIKNQKTSLVRIVPVSEGYLHNEMCACTALYHSLILLLPCLKDVNISNLACTTFDCGLQNSSNFVQMVCNFTSVAGRVHEMYISSPTSPDYWITFLHLALSWSIESPQSRMFSHLIFHYINLAWRASSMI